MSWQFIFIIVLSVGQENYSRVIIAILSSFFPFWWQRPAGQLRLRLRNIFSLGIYKLGGGWGEETWISEMSMQ